MPDLRPSRRELLERGTLLAAAAVAGAARPAGAPAGDARVGRRTTRVILVAFAGGVRSRETFGTPGNVPNLVALAQEGVLYPNMRTANLGHYGAALSMFTGISEPRGIRENSRGPDPTLFEYLRKDLGLEASDVWITTSGGAQQANYAFGLHPDYGPRYGATTLDGDGIFNRQFQELLRTLGKPGAFERGERAALDRLRRALASQGDGAADPVREAEDQARVEEYILSELTRGTSDLAGAGAADAKALRLARNLVTVFKPRVTAIVLQDADVAHGSFNGYQEVIRRNDAAIGELRAAIQADPQLSQDTALFVCPEFGRDRDLNSRRGLDHGDGSDDLRLVSCVAWGPDFRRGVVVREEQEVIGLAPTVCELLGAKAKHSRAQGLRGLYA